MRASKSPAYYLSQKRSRPMSASGFVYPDTSIWYPNNLKQHCYQFPAEYRVMPYVDTPSFSYKKAQRVSDDQPF